MATPGGWRRAGDPLNVTEKLMLEHAASGEMLDGIDDIPPSEPTAMQAGSPPRTVRAAVVRRLLTEAELPVDPKGVRLRRVRITCYVRTVSSSAQRL